MQSLKKIHAWAQMQVPLQDEFNLLQNLHLYSQRSVCATSTRPFGDVGGKSPIQLTSRAHFAKIEDKKLLRKRHVLFTSFSSFQGDSLIF